MSTRNVVVVESPTKAQTIEKFLGRDFKVVASYGHVRDLPKSKLGIDVEHNFEPQYIIPRGEASRIKQLKSAIGQAKNVYLATDPDREGEAIAWHILQAIPPEKNQVVKRITYTEVTKPALQAAVASPREIDQHLVDAQQARRVVDRLVGYSLSPVLWKKVRNGLSAGRVQSVAVKLIVDREREIQAFKPDEYWSIEAQLQSPAQESVTAKLSKIEGKKAEINNEAEAQKITAELKSGQLKVASVDSREVKRSPAPPFITSTLQQEAFRRLGYTSRRTMVIAQQLYESGHITYMRTDSFNLSTQALNGARQLIKSLYGPSYLPPQPRAYKKKVRGAQEAHEAIRPTDFSKVPDQLSGLSADQLKLYRLIWQRAAASQMSDAKYLQKGADIVSGPYTLRATGRETLFEGFSKVYLESKDDEEQERDQQLAELKQGDAMKLIELKPEQHFTSPPPRYTEASLIKKLEESGIGRPTTYAPTISTIASRGYVKVENRQLVPQDVGFWVCDLLTSHFPFVVSEKFTAEMEDKLDDIAEGKTNWQPVVAAFYEPLDSQIRTETDKIQKVKIPEIPTDEVCDVCGKPMVIKTGRFGQFLACSGFPECKNTKKIQKTIGAKCPECEVGEVVEKRTRKGRTFWGCSRYPDCKFASWQKPKAEATL